MLHTIHRDTDDMKFVLRFNSKGMFAVCNVSRIFCLISANCQAAVDQFCGERVLDQLEIGIDGLIFLNIADRKFIAALLAAIHLR